MRLNGWMRIIVVLSALWMVGGTVYFWIDEGRARNRFNMAMLGEWHRCDVENRERRYRNQPEVPCRTEREMESSLMGVPDFWRAAIIPCLFLVAAWLWLAITYGAVRWIKKGFAGR